MKNFKTVVLTLVFAVSTLFANQNAFNQFKTTKEKLGQLYKQSTLTKENTNDILQLKKELFEFKNEIKQQSIDYPKTVIDQDSMINLGNNFILINYKLFDYSDDSYRIIGYIKSTSATYSQYVRINFHQKKDGNWVNSDYTYIDFDTYESSGMLPYSFSFFDTFIDKIDFDEIAFDIEYSDSRGFEKFNCDQIFTIISNDIIEDGYTDDWMGCLENNYNYSFTFPQIFACFFKNGLLVECDYTYLDTECNSNRSVIIYYYTDSPDEREQITLKNCTDKAIDLSGWTLGNSINKNAFTIPQNTIIGAGDTKRFTHSQLGFEILDDDEAIYLKDNEGKDVFIYDDNYDSNMMMPYTSSCFDSYLDVPTDYDEVKFLKSFSIYSLEGSGNVPPNIPNFDQPSYNTKQRQEFNIELFLIDLNNDNLTVVIDWGDGSTNEISSGHNSRSYPNFTHNYSQEGLYYIKCKSSDGELESEWSDEILVNVTAIQELEIQNTSVKQAIYLNTFADTLTATGGIPPYSWEITGSLPQGLELDNDNGILYGKPKESGEYEMIVSVSDNGTPSISKQEDFTLFVINHPPVVEADTLITINEHDYLDMVINMSDLDNNPIIIDHSNLPSWATYESAHIFGTIPESAQDTLIKIIATDNELSDTLVTFIDIIPVNDPPQLTSENNISTPQDTLFSYIAKATDPEDSSITYVFENLPSWLTTQDSLVTGITPIGSPDTSFTIIASDGELSDTLLVTIHFQENAAPQIQNISNVQFTNDSNYILDLDSCATDQDHDIEELSWSVKTIIDQLVTEIDNNILTLSAPNWTGTTNIVLTVSDPLGAKDSLNIDIVVTFPLSLNENESIPKSFSLNANYPNPFNPSTTISYTVAEKSYVRLEIFDINGRLVTTLTNAEHQPGSYHLEWNAATHSSGVYLCRMTAGSYTNVRKMLLIK